MALTELRIEAEPVWPEQAVRVASAAKDLGVTVAQSVLRVLTLRGQPREPLATHGDHFDPATSRHELYELGMPTDVRG